MYIYTNNNLLQERLGVNPIAYNEKNMLSENFISYVDKSLNKKNTSKEDPLVSYEDKTNMSPSNSQMMAHKKNFCFQYYCLMLSFGND